MNDPIDRQAAIDALKDMYKAAEKWGEEASDDVTKARAESCMATLIEMKLRTEQMPSANLQPTCNQLATDCISRRAAIDAMKSISDSICEQQAIDALCELPYAQPDIDEWCHDCKEYDKERHCCPRWNRVIRQTLKDAQPDLPEWARKVEEYRKSAPDTIYNPLAWALYQAWKEYDR